VLRGDPQGREVIAGLLNCKLGKFSMIYLGVPIHTRKLRKPDLQIVNEKMRKIMSFYHLTDGYHEELDSIRRRFSGGG
jgi:hypothetical protein